MKIREIHIKPPHDLPLMAAPCTKRQVREGRQRSLRWDEDVVDSHRNDIDQRPTGDPTPLDAVNIGSLTRNEEFNHKKRSKNRQKQQMFGCYQETGHVSSLKEM